MTLQTVRDEVEVMCASGEWDNATTDHYVVLYYRLFRDLYGVDALEPAKEVYRTISKLLTEIDFGEAGGLAEYVRWAFEGEHDRKRAGKESNLKASFLFSKSKVSDYRLFQKRQGVSFEEEEMPESPAVWTTKLDKAENGSVKPTIGNVVTVLLHDEAWRDVIAYDEFAAAITTRKPPPWNEDDAPEETKAGTWCDEDITRLCAWLGRSEYRLHVRPTMVGQAVAVVAARKNIHPVRDYLASLSWDNEPRLDTWLSDYCGVVDDEYSRAVGRCFLISAVARAMRPGCKVDTTPVLVGKQGEGKSRLVRTLFSDEWTLETQAELGTKDAYQSLHRKWGVELAELDSLSRSEAARVKAFLSAQTDTYRPSYGRGTKDYHRQCVFVGTTNADTFLKDESGARRFWPIQVTRIDIDGLAAARDDLWAEAYARYVSGEIWHIADTKLLRRFEAEQAERYQADPWEEKIDLWLCDATKAQHRRRHGVTTLDILQGPLRLDVQRMGRAEQMRVGSCLTHLGWERQRKLAGGVRSYRYHPAGAAADSKGKAGGGQVGPEEGHTSTRKNKAGSTAALPALPKSPDKGSSNKGDGTGGSTASHAYDPGSVGQVGHPPKLPSRSEAMRARLRLLNGGQS